MLQKTLLSGLLLLAWGPNAFSQSLFISDFASDPAQAATGVREEKGRKGLRVLMGYTGGGPGYPIDITAASVTLTINGTPNTCTRNMITPPVSACGYIKDHFDASHPDVDTVKVFYNGDFPSLAAVSVAVSGVKAADATTQTPGSIAFAAGNIAPRTPASLEMVFDISGSMAWPVVPPTVANPIPEARMDALKRSAQALFFLLDGHAMMGDKIGDVFFSTTASGGTLQAAHDPTQVSALAANVQAQIPTNSTSIGAGLALANSAGLAADGNPRKFVLLFSDGEQNTAPNVSFVGPTLQVGGVNYPAAIKVCPITAGRMAAPGFALQQQIATASCAGHNLHVSDTDQTLAQSDFDTYFVQTMTDALIGDKLEIVKDVSGVVTPGTPATEKFLGNTRDTAMSLLLSWSGGGQFTERGLQLKLTAPNGIVVDLTGRVRFGRQMRFLTLHFPLRQGGSVIDPKGQWTVQITSPIPGGTTGIPPINYHLMVVEDNETISSDSSLNIQDAGTGEPVPIKVTLTEGGAPVAGAAVTAQIVGPDNGLGDILAKAANPTGTPNTSGDPVGSDANKKLLLLLDRPEFIALLKDHGLPTVTLSDSGGGMYSGTFNGADKEGHYQFVITIRGTSATNGDFERTRKLTLFVRPKPDPAKTGLVLVSSMVQPSGKVQVHLRATPQDRFNSLLGPDYLPQLDITSSQGGVVIPIADDLHGSYDVTYELPSAASNPTIGLVVMGQTVVQKKLRDIPHGGGGGTAGKWVVSLHLGATIPHNLTGFSSSVSVGGDLEYRLTSMLSLETYLGYDRFTHGAFAALHFVNLSERFKITAPTGNLRPFVYAGFGGYFGSSGGNHPGINTGAGLQYWFRPKFAVEGSYNFHNVFISGGDARYSTVLGGVRFAF